MQPEPVFILGLHRSGTTLLYELLGATGCFNVVTARHVAFFDGIARPGGDVEGFDRRVAERFGSLEQADRGVDGVSVGPDTPEEYGFLLERLTGSRGFSASSGGALRCICDMIQRDSGARRPTLLKNPWDFDRADLLREVFPGARFVFIHRNPFHVLSSTLRMTLALAERRSAYLAMLSDRYAALSESEFPWRVVRRLGRGAPGLMADWIIRYFASRAKGFLRVMPRGDWGSFPHIRYEELCEDPDDVISTTLDRLGFTLTAQDFAGHIGPSRSSVHELIAARRGRIVDLFGAYASRFGYDLERIGDELSSDSLKQE